jgi:hypothetical protein
MRDAVQSKKTTQREHLRGGFEIASGLQPRPNVYC